MPELIRWLVVAELLTLFASLGAVVAIEDAATKRAPSSWRWVAAGVMLVLGGVSIAVTTNAILNDAATRGILVLLPVCGVAAACGVVAVVKAVRHQPRTLAEFREQQVMVNAAPIAEALSHLPHLEPCPDPVCTRTRRELAALAGDTSAPPT